MCSRAGLPPGAPDGAVYETVQVNPKFLWRLQDLGDAENMRYLLRKGQASSRASPRKRAHATGKWAIRNWLTKPIGFQIMLLQPPSRHNQTIKPYQTK